MRFRAYPLGLLGSLALVAAGFSFVGTPTTAREMSVVAAVTNAPARGLPDSALSPLSLRQQQMGEKALADGDLSAATDSFEAALVADPRNRQGFLGLARVAEAQGLYGKAVRYYRNALEIEPNDLNVLELQGSALVKRGATGLASETLDRMTRLCATTCPQRDRLATVIAQNPKTAQTGATTPAAPVAANAGTPKNSPDTTQ